MKSTINNSHAAPERFPRLLKYKYGTYVIMATADSLPNCYRGFVVYSGEDESEPVGSKGNYDKDCFEYFDGTVNLSNGD